MKGHLELLLLAIIEDGAKHGYAVIEELRRRTDGAIDLPRGHDLPSPASPGAGRSVDQPLGRGERSPPT